MPRALTLLAIAGSLRSTSSNRTLLEAAAALAPPDVTVWLSDHLSRLPHFNPDLDLDPWPAAVASWRRDVAGADGLLLSVPEYAHGLPGSFKNGLDWLVSDPAVLHKPIAVWNASGRGEHARASLLEILRTMSTTVVAEAGVTLPLLDGPFELATLTGTPALRASLSRALEHFVKAIRQPATE
ncbi:MAG TPA: NADPH-dependent FMN reductase [Gemmatimonadales bacterium]|nr:NADPH-dependent FMN reductase [Gemmatimonadales bacterium]